jgi:hypothetical protein
MCGPAWVVDTLRHLGFLELAEEAMRVLPDRVGLERVQEFASLHGLSRDESGTACK